MASSGAEHSDNGDATTFWLRAIDEPGDVIDPSVFQQEVKARWEAFIATLPAGTPSVTVRTERGVQRVFCQVFEGSPLVKKVILSSTVIVIGNDAFLDCVNLESVEHIAPDDDEGSNQPKRMALKDGAFNGCTSLRSIQFAPWLLIIHRGALSNCGSLTEIQFPRHCRLHEICSGAFDSCRSLVVVDLSNCELLTVIQICAFADCPLLERVDFPQQSKCLGAICREAFGNCPRLQSAVIPESVNFLGSNTYEQCTALTKVEFQSTKNLSHLLNFCQFQECTFLHTLVLPHAAVPSTLWPRLLETFLKSRGILDRSGIANPSQRLSIALNFLRQNREEFCQTIKQALHRKRPRVSPPGSGIETAPCSLGRMAATRRPSTRLVTRRPSRDSSENAALQARILELERENASLKELLEKKGAS